MYEKFDSKLHHLSNPMSKYFDNKLKEQEFNNNNKIQENYSTSILNLIRICQ